MNVADANRLESGFHHIGLENTEDVNNADIIVLNSCVVRQSAEDKVHGMLSSCLLYTSPSPRDRG